MGIKNLHHFLQFWAFFFSIQLSNVVFEKLHKRFEESFLLTLLNKKSQKARNHLIILAIY